MDCRERQVQELTKNGWIGEYRSDTHGGQGKTYQRKEERVDLAEEWFQNVQHRESFSIKFPTWAGAGAGAGERD